MAAGHGAFAVLAAAPALAAQLVVVQVLEGLPTRVVHGTTIVAIASALGNLVHMARA